MSLLDYFRRNRKSSASVAKERLQIIVAHERASRGAPDFLPMLQKEILEVISKYIDVDKDQIKVNFDRTGGCDVLELNVLLPVTKR
jgi:cell division topological specificity factor